MRFIIFLTALSFFFSISSCTSVPKESHYWLSWQKKSEAPRHWNTLAKQVAKDVNCVLQGGITTAPATPPTGFGHVVPETSGAVFVQDNDRSPFGNAIRTLVSQALIDRGIQITQNKQSSVVLDWEVQPITTLANRCNSPGLPELLLLDLPKTLLFGEGGSFVVGPGGFIYAENFCVPHSEVIITFLLRNNDVGIMRKSRLFYINDEDVGLYWNTANLNRTTLVESPMPVVFQSVSQ